jgi:hypothetical protein
MIPHWRTTVIYFVVAVALASTVVGLWRMVHLSRAWWVAVEEGLALPSTVVDYDYPHVTHHRDWNGDVVRYMLDLIVRLYRCPLHPGCDSRGGPGIDMITMLGSNPAFPHGSVMQRPGTWEMWISFRGVWSVGEMLTIFSVHQLPFHPTNPVPGAVEYALAADQPQRPYHQAHERRSGSTESDFSVHAGIFAEYDTFRKQLLTTIRGLKHKPPLILLGGHSMGGAMATLAYYDLVNLGYACHLYSFGACRALSPAFRECVEHMWEGGGQITLSVLDTRG